MRVKTAITEQEVPPYMESKHSGVGIASFVISIAVAVLLLVTIVIAGVMEMTTPGGIDDESVGAILVGLTIMGLFGLDIVAFGLGIGRLLQKSRKRIFAVLGVIFSAGAVMLTVVLMVIGIAVG